jgi:hypothetical protein
MPSVKSGIIALRMKSEISSSATRHIILSRYPDAAFRLIWVNRFASPAVKILTRRVRQNNTTGKIPLNLSGKSSL